MHLVQCLGGSNVHKTLQLFHLFTRDSPMHINQHFSVYINVNVPVNELIFSCMKITEEIAFRFLIKMSLQVVFDCL